MRQCACTGGGALHMIGTAFFEPVVLASNQKDTGGTAIGHVPIDGTRRVITHWNTRAALCVEIENVAITFSYTWTYRAERAGWGSEYLRLSRCATGGVDTATRKHCAEPDRRAAMMCLDQLEHDVRVAPRQKEIGIDRFEDVRPARFKRAASVAEKRSFPGRTMTCLCQGISNGAVSLRY